MARRRSHRRPDRQHQRRKYQHRSAAYKIATCDANDADRAVTRTAHTALTCALTINQTVISAADNHRHPRAKRRGSSVAPELPRTELRRLALNDELPLPPRMAGRTRSVKRAAA